jgi:hypothetical protein
MQTMKALSNILHRRRLAVRALLVGGVLAGVSPIFCQAPAAAPVDLAAQAKKIEPFLGVYELVPADKVLPGGLKATGDLSDLKLTAPAAEAAKKSNPKLDAAKICRIVGPVRMMALPGTRMELVPTLRNGFYMMFKNSSLGNRRQIEFAGPPTAPVEPFWIGHSYAHWKDATTFVVDTTGYNDRTWLNSAGAPSSDKLHTVEEYRLLPSGDLKLTMTVTDPVTLTAPFTYVRYYARQQGILGELSCEEDFRQNR